MLCLTLKIDQTVAIGDATVTLLRAGSGKSRLGIAAPQNIPIVRVCDDDPGDDPGDDPRHSVSAGFVVADAPVPADCGLRSPGDIAILHHPDAPPSADTSPHPTTPSPARSEK